MKKLSLISAALIASITLLQGVYANTDTEVKDERFDTPSRISSQGATGRYFVLSQVAFQGAADKRFGWPVYAGSFERAVNMARNNGIAAFHYYVDGDSASGYMYPFYSINGYEPREGNRQTVGVIMEQSSVH